MGSSWELQHPPLSVWVWGWDQLLCFYSSTSAYRECLASHVPLGNHVMHNLRATFTGLFFSGFFLHLISLLFLHGQRFLETGLIVISEGKKIWFCTSLLLFVDGNGSDWHTAHRHRSAVYSWRKSSWIQMQMTALSFLNFLWMCSEADHCTSNLWPLVTNQLLCQNEIVNHFVSPPFFEEHKRQANTFL